MPSGSPHKKLVTFNNKPYRQLLFSHKTHAKLPSCAIESFNWIIKQQDASTHDDVIKWKHFPRYCPFARGIHRSPVNSPHKGQWRGALMFSLICGLKNVWVNNREADDLGRQCAHYDVIVMIYTDAFIDVLVCAFFLQYMALVISNSFG